MTALTQSVLSTKMSSQMCIKALIINSSARFISRRITCGWARLTGISQQYSTNKPVVSEMLSRLHFPVVINVPIDVSAHAR